MLYVFCVVFFFFFKQKTAYEMVSCDWSSDVCSSDLGGGPPRSSDTDAGACPELRGPAGGVRLQPGAFDAERSRQQLRVSPQHRSADVEPGVRSGGEHVAAPARLSGTDGFGA